MAVSDITIAQDGGGNVKLHPYFITLVRWCVSCVWSIASVLLHRLVLAPLPQITASKQSSKAIPKPRQAGTEHLHPEPKVECVVLHTPEAPTLDVIFVHGLYGSLANTWRQGDWRSKYKLNPKKISLRNHTTPCECQTKSQKQYINYTYETNLNERDINETVSFKQINSCFNKILPNENTLITEKFYNNTILDVNVNSYETQARFVSEMFKNETQRCDLNIDTFKCNLDRNKFNCTNVDHCKCKINCNFNECKCKLNDQTKSEKCKIGCGCICDKCYSECWPKDWIKEDFPGARIISINYTSDPYLWRPLWVKGNKRLRLHERAGQMMKQLLDLGVGKRPVIWVGHSKGGLFIKQIYCEGYDAYNKINEIKTNKIEERNQTADNLDNNINIYNKSTKINIENFDENRNIANSDKEYNSYQKNAEKSNQHINLVHTQENFNFLKYTKNRNTQLCGCTEKDELEEDRQDFLKETGFIDINMDDRQGLLEETGFIDINMDDSEEVISKEMNEDRNEEVEDMSLNNEEDIEWLQAKCSLWQQSAGFMFYSVPHRGSPLADIKTPITSRSIELLEISKDCDLVLDLQDRWLVATSSSRPVVRSLVETCRTLMSVLWLRIVSVDSADAGVGSLYGVSVDHREICKPSSRSCLLYTELTSLIQNAINKCQCRTKEKHT